MIDFQKQYALWDEFLAVWPASRLATMTLDEYSQAGSKDSFTYWIESRLDQMGSIWGGSSFKFGVFSRKDTEEKNSDAKLSYSETHGWYSSLGTTAEAAFDHVRGSVVQVADWANKGDLDAIESFENLGEAFKWKIAFHYQNRQKPVILDVFKPAMLAAYTGGSKIEGMAALQRAALALRPQDMGILEFGQQVWEAWSQKSLVIWKLSHGNPPNFTEEERQQFLDDRWAVMHRETGKEQGKKFAEAPVGALFFLCHGNSPQRIGQFTSEASPCAKGDGWLQRSYRVLKHAQRTDRYTSNSKNWSPQGNSTFWQVGANDLPEFESTLLKPFFGTDLAEVAALAGEPIEASSQDDGVTISTPPAADAGSKKSSATCFNRIYYGPPGTGKTHTTIEAALDVLDPAFLAAHAGEDQRDARKRRFDELVDDRLIRFVTFHQSFSYEDFVEGLRANTEDGKLKYVVVEGVFKAICSDAATRVTVRNEANISLDGRRIWKMSLGNTLGDDADVYDDCIANNYILLGYGGAVDYTGCVSREEILRRFQTVEPNAKPGDFTVDAVDRFLKMKKGDLVVVSDGNFKFRAIGEISGDYRSLGQESYGQCRDVKWLRVYAPSLSKEQLLSKQFSQATIYELKSGVVDKAKLAALLSASTEAGERAGRPHVLIIDEINRGNVSRIFGELITLIEPSKRAGAPEALSVVLPYSKESFSVPDNVYLIGTMNTADRSLAGLDIALRRRFVFQEMPPKPELLQGVTIEGINIGQLLSVLNQRIEVLLDRDHCLGHAYFLPLKHEPTFAKLSDLFRQQILPLLQEYFFEDWERIRWVLNDQQAPAGVEPFIRPSAASSSLERLFGSKAADLGGITRWELNPPAFASEASFRNILGHS